MRLRQRSVHEARAGGGGWLGGQHKRWAQGSAALAGLGDAPPCNGCLGKGLCQHAAAGLMQQTDRRHPEAARLQEPRLLRKSPSRRCLQMTRPGTAVPTASGTLTWLGPLPAGCCWGAAGWYTGSCGRLSGKLRVLGATAAQSDGALRLMRFSVFTSCTACSRACPPVRWPLAAAFLKAPGWSACACTTVPCVQWGMVRSAWPCPVSFPKILCLLGVTSWPSRSSLEGFQLLTPRPGLLCYIDGGML